MADEDEVSVFAGETEAEPLTAADVPGVNQGVRLREYWAHGKGAVKIRWGQPGDFKRCVRNLRKYSKGETEFDTEGLCANLHHEVLGVWPGREHGKKAHTAIDPNFNAKHPRGFAGRFGLKLGTPDADELDLGPRIRLGTDETFLGSETAMPLDGPTPVTAWISGPGGTKVRLGLIPEDDVARWGAEPKGATVELDDGMRTQLRDGIRNAASVRGRLVPEAEARQMDLIGQRNRILARAVGPNRERVPLSADDKKAVADLDAQLDELTADADSWPAMDGTVSTPWGDVHFAVEDERGEPYAILSIGEQQTALDLDDVDDLLTFDDTPVVAALSGEALARFNRLHRRGKAGKFGFSDELGDALHSMRGDTDADFDSAYFPDREGVPENRYVEIERNARDNGWVLRASHDETDITDIEGEPEALEMDLEDDELNQVIAAMSAAAIRDGLPPLNPSDPTSVMLHTLVEATDSGWTSRDDKDVFVSFDGDVLSLGNAGGEVLDIPINGAELNQFVAALRETQQGRRMAQMREAADKFAQERAATTASYGDAPEEATPDMGGALPGELWHAVAHVEDISTGKRTWVPGAITWREPPFAFHTEMQSSAHGSPMTTVQVGLVTRVARVGDAIHAWGTIDLDSDLGMDFARRLVQGFARWVSMDPDETPIAYDLVMPANSTGMDAEPEQVVFYSYRLAGLTSVSMPAQEGSYLEPTDALLEALMEPVTAAAVVPHDTPTTDVPWDADMNVGRLPSPMSVETARKVFAWIDESRVEDGMLPHDAAKMPHHLVSQDGTPGAADLDACSAAIGSLNGARNEPDIPAADFRGVYNHLAAHLRDAGREDVPTLTTGIDAHDTDINTCTCMGQDGRPVHPGKCRVAPGGARAAERAARKAPHVGPKSGKGADRMSKGDKLRQLLKNHLAKLPENRMEWSGADRRKAIALEKAIKLDDDTRKAKAHVPEQMSEAEADEFIRKAQKRVQDAIAAEKAGKDPKRPYKDRIVRISAEDARGELAYLAKRKGSDRNGPMWTDEDRDEAAYYDEAIFRASPEGRAERAKKRTAGKGTSITVASNVHVLELPDLPPPEWFEEPLEMDAEPGGPIHVTDEGRVYGWLVPEGIGHRSYARQGQRKEFKDLGKIDFSRWLNETIVAGGTRVLAGPITMDCDHAPTQGYGTLKARNQHYENTCSIVGRVATGIGTRHKGQWIAGALMPWITPQQFTTLLASRMSGDWQPHPEKPGWQEFIAALVVPVPGWAGSRTGVTLASAAPVYSIREDEDSCWIASASVPITAAGCGCYVIDDEDVEPYEMDDVEPWEVEEPPQRMPWRADPAILDMYASDLGLDKRSRMREYARMIG